MNQNQETEEAQRRSTAERFLELDGGMAGARYEVVMRSVVDGLLIGLLALPLSPVSGAWCVGGLGSQLIQ